MNFRREIWTYLIVTSVTVLIWLWAAAETRDQKATSARVQLRVADVANWVITPEARTVTLTMEGSKLSLQKANEALRQALSIELLSPRPGTRTVDLATAIREHEAIAATGINILAVEPGAIEIEIDEIVRIPARIRPVLPGVNTVGEIEIEPPDATIVMPGALRMQYPGELTVDAYVDRARLDQLEPNERHTIDAPLRPGDALPASAQISILPRLARLSFTVRSRIRETRLDSVRVQLAGPPEDQREFLVEVEDNILRDVVIRADANIISRIESREATVVAMVHVSSREKEQGIERKPVTYFLALIPEADGTTRTAIVEAEVAGSTELPIVGLTISRTERE